MTPLFIYFIKVNLALALLYISYRFLFQHDTFFKLRRISLLGIIFIAFSYQLPDISEWLSHRPSVTEAVSYYSSILPRETISITTVDDTMGYDWEKIGIALFLVIYLIGVIVLSVRCIAELTHVFRTYHRCRKASINGMQVCILPEPDEAHSFFRWIFIPSKQSDRQVLDEILQHEAAHVRQMHSLDVMLGEIVSIICWINPFAWLLKQEIGINHEYLADQQVIYAGYNKKEYQYHLIGMGHPNMAAANLYNNFSVLPLKKRITMLNKKRTNGVGIIKYLAFVPLTAVLLLVNNIDAMARLVVEKVTEQVTSPASVVETSPLIQPVAEAVEAPLPPDDKIYDKCEVMPKFPGGPSAILQFLAKNIKYPAKSIEQKEQGRAFIKFVVEKDGSVSNVKVVRSLTPLLDEEAIRVVKAMPKWTPGKDAKGNIVRVEYTLPVIFRLS